MARIVQFREAGSGNRVGVNPEMVVRISPGPGDTTLIELVAGGLVTVGAEFNEVVGSLNNPPGPGPAELGALL